MGRVPDRVLLRLPRRLQRREDRSVWLEPRFVLSQGDDEGGAIVHRLHAWGHAVFLFYSAAAPHAAPHPIDGEKTAIPAARDVDRYAQIAAWRPATFGNLDDVTDMAPYIQRRNWSRRVSDQVDLVRQRQLESLTSLDRQVGRLVEALPGNTMVVFMSDNGYMWGEHRWKTKKVPYERASGSR